MRALLVFDRPGPIVSLTQYLKGTGHAVLVSSSRMALTAIDQDRPDIVFIATWDIQSLSVFFLELQRLYQSASRLPLTVAIANHEEENLDSLYEVGFDLVSLLPLRESVMMAQVRALDRRLGISSRTLVSPHLLVDLHTHHAFLKSSDGTLLADLNVGQIQFILLTCFLRYPQRVWGRGELLERLKHDSESQKLNDEILDIRVVDGNIYRLRKALKDALAGSLKPWSIDKSVKEGFFHTERSGGYFFLDAVKMEGEVIDLYTLSQTLSVA